MGLKLDSLGQSEDKFGDLVAGDLFTFPQSSEQYMKMGKFIEYRYPSVVLQAVRLRDGRGVTFLPDSKIKKIPSGSKLAVI